MKRFSVSAPIGVFDSGLGGLTVFRSLRRALPRERIIYLGDTARVPYGPKTKQAVTRYSIECASFLESKGIKMLVVACNTASSLALEPLSRRLRVPVVGVIGPAVRAAAAETRTGSIGLIGTEATVASGAYQKAFTKIPGKITVRAQACPLFVPLIEEGWWDDSVTRQVARRYLAGLKRADMDVLILGCTHYPLMKPLLESVAGRGVRLIDSADAAAGDVRERLASRGLLRRAGSGSERFYVTDGPERFTRLARRFLGGKSRKADVVRFG